MKKQFGSTPHEKPNYGTNFLNALILIEKNDTEKNVLGARHFKSKTDHSSESWPLDPLTTQTARANKKHNSTINLTFACACATLDDENIKLTGFSSGEKIIAFIRIFQGLQSLPNFFTQTNVSVFEGLDSSRTCTGFY